MKKTFHLLYLVTLIAASTPTLATTSETNEAISSTKNQKRNNKLIALGLFIVGIFAGVGSYSLYNRLYNKLSPEVAACKTWIDEGTEGRSDKVDFGQTFKPIYKHGLKDKENRNWRGWIEERNDKAVNDLAVELKKKKYDITKNFFSTKEIEKLVVKDPTTRIGIKEINNQAFLLTQLFYLIKDIMGEKKKKEFVNLKQDFFFTLCQEHMVHSQVSGL